MLFASPTEDLLHDINDTYSSTAYKKLFNENHSFTLNDFEHNTSQRRIKEDFEKILPAYLNTDNVFSEESIDELCKDDSCYLSNYHLQEFIVTSSLYIKLLDKQSHTTTSTQLLEKNLLDLQLLLRNSKGMVNHILAVVLYQKLYSELDVNSLEKFTLLKKLPPPEKTVFFEKLDDDRQWVLNNLENLCCDKQVDKKDYNEKEFKKLMGEVTSTAKQQVNVYYDMMAEALKCESHEEVERFNRYIKEESDKHMSAWNITRFFFSGLKIKTFNAILGYNNDYGYFSEFMGETLALVAVPKLTDIYLEHIDMIHQYENLLETSSERYNKTQEPIKNPRAAF